MNFLLSNYVALNWCVSPADLDERSIHKLYKAIEDNQPELVKLYLQRVPLQELTGLYSAALDSGNPAILVYLLNHQAPLIGDSIDCYARQPYLCQSPGELIQIPRFWRRMNYRNGNADWTLIRRPVMANGLLADAISGEKMTTELQ